MSFNKLQSLNNIELNLGGLGQAVNEIQALDNIAAKFGAGGTITFGTYQPIASNLVNLTVCNPAIAMFTRIGNIVNVAGLVGLTITAATTWSYFQSLPIPTDIQVIGDLAGALGAGAVGNIPLNVIGNVAGNIASIAGSLTGVPGSVVTASYVFSYVVK